jgi:hypothetical protein
MRVLPYPTAQGPLAVSASRGVGCVLAGCQRVLLFDLEEDEEGEDEEAEMGVAGGGDEEMETDEACSARGDWPPPSPGSSDKIVVPN